MSTNSKVAISWHRLPPYAARLIKAGIENIDEPVHIIASKPPALVEEVEQILGKSICWIDTTKSYSWSDLGIDVPKIFFQSGWLSQAFRDLGTEVHQKGGKVICFSDNCWKNSPRQWLGSIVFRIRHRPKFDAIWVPGVSGSKLARFFGMSVNRIYQGMYGADAEVFNPGITLSQRDKKFVFVGQIIKRKGIDILIEAFSKFYEKYPDWNLHIIGNGSLESLLNVPGVKIEGFQSPNYVANVLKQSRFLLLPSYEEHWGLVVHEAALCGCGLIVSDAVGSRLDLVSDTNGFTFPVGSAEELHKTMLKAAALNESELDSVFEQSQRMASNFGTQRWVVTFQKIVNESGLECTPQLTVSG